MQVLCKSTNGNAEAHCCVCGQGIIMFWERQSRMERADALRDIQKVLVSHHRAATGPAVHPQGTFLVPEWNGPVNFFEAAAPEQAANWSI